MANEITVRVYEQGNATPLASATVNRGAAFSVPAGSGLSVGSHIIEVTTQDTAAGFAESLHVLAGSINVASGGNPSLAASYPVSADRAGGTGTNPMTVTLPATAAGATILLFLAADGSSGSAAQSFNTPTSANLTWSLVQRHNTQVVYSGNTGFGGTVEVWKAVVGSSLSAGEAVSLTTAANGQSSQTPAHATVTAVGFLNAVTVRAVSASSSSSKARQVTVTATTANSLVYAVGNDYWSHPIQAGDGGQGVLTGDVLDHNLFENTIATSWTEHATAPSAGGDVTVGINPYVAVGDGWAMIGVEIRGS